MPQFFIDRPVFAWVVALFILLAGALAIPQLPVAQYPNVAPPKVEIFATYPGASAQTVDESVVSLIEEELNGADHLLYFESQSSLGSATITATFQPGTDPEMAQVDVQKPPQGCRVALAASGDSAGFAGGESLRRFPAADHSHLQ